MGIQRIAAWAAAAALLASLASCATGKVVVQNVHSVANGGTVDHAALSQAFASDRKVIGGDLTVLRQRFAKALAALTANVQQHWGQADTRVASRTVYVKYTQGYKTRVITDFDHGTITIETLDAGVDLKGALIAALLTPNDPAALDLFSDKDVLLESGREPYLYGLVHDNHGNSVRTRAQAEAFAAYLVAQRLQTRTIAGAEGNGTARFVRLTMIKDFETHSADRYRPAVERYAARYGVSPTLVLAIMRTESNFNPFAVSPAPAYGLMQLVPTTGGRDAFKRAEGVDQVPTPEYLFDPEHNIELGAAYLSQLSNEDFHEVGDPMSRDYCVIAAYNTGAGNVNRTFGGNRAAALQSINSLPPPALFEKLKTDLPSEETRLYVVKVTGYRRQFVAATSPAPGAAAAGIGSHAAGAQATSSP